MMSDQITPLPSGKLAPFFYDWPCVLEMDASGSFILTPLYLAGCRRASKTEAKAIADARQCLRSFIVGEPGSPSLLTHTESEVQPISGRTIYLRVDVMSAQE